MARIKYSAIVDTINGSINGTTFQRNRYGSTVKGKPAMVRPSSLFQQQQKQLMTRVAQSWRTLTELQRQDWIAFAEANPKPSRLNPDAYLNGYNFFGAYHRYRSLYDSTILTSPSLTLEEIGTVTIDMYTDGVDLFSRFQNADFSGSWIILMFYTGVIPFGREFINTTPRYLIGRPFNADEYTDVSTEYKNKIGSYPTVGQYVGVKYVRLCLTTGQFTVTTPYQTEVLLYVP